MTTNKHPRYLPFGDGLCVRIGKRLGKMQIKLPAAIMLRDFRYELTDSMKREKIQYLNTSFAITPANGIELFVYKR